MVRGEIRLSICASDLLFRAALSVLARGADRAIRALGCAHSVLGLGFAAVAGLSGRHAIRILLGNSRVSRLRVVGSGRTIGPLGDTRSIPGLGGAAVSGLGGCYPVRILVGNSGIARIRVDSSGTLAILADGFTAKIFDAILLRKHTRSKQHAH